MSSERLADMNENWAAWLEFTADHTPGGESKAFGAIRCSSVGVPMPMFNQAFVFEEPVADDLSQATRWLAKRQVPFRVATPESIAGAVAGLAGPVGLNAEAVTTPGMVYAPLTDLPTQTDDQAEIVTLTEPAQLDDFALVASEAFGAPLEAGKVLTPASTLEDRRCSWFVGYVDGEPAACGQLLRDADVAGVYSIGVREKFRRRGLGAAVSAAVLVAGRDAGCSIGVLQASPMGAPVYDRMGFETITQYHCFDPAS